MRKNPVRIRIKKFKQFYYCLLKLNIFYLTYELHFSLRFKFIVSTNSLIISAEYFFRVVHNRQVDLCFLRFVILNVKLVMSFTLNYFIFLSLFEFYSFKRKLHHFRFLISNWHTLWNCTYQFTWTMSLRLNFVGIFVGFFLSLWQFRFGWCASFCWMRCQ